MTEEVPSWLYPKADLTGRKSIPNLDAIEGQKRVAEIEDGYWLTEFEGTSQEAIFIKKPGKHPTDHRPEGYKDFRVDYQNWKGDTTSLRHTDLLKWFVDLRDQNDESAELLYQQSLLVLAGAPFRRINILSRRVNDISHWGYLNSLKWILIQEDTRYPIDPESIDVSKLEIRYQGRTMHLFRLCELRYNVSPELVMSRANKRRLPEFLDDKSVKYQEVLKALCDSLN